MPDAARLSPGGWMVELDATDPLATLSTPESSGLRVERSAAGAEVWIDWPHLRHQLLHVPAQGPARLPTGPTQNDVYARTVGTRCRLSNVASLLMEPGEEVAVNTFVLVQQLLGAHYPIDMLFPSIPKLEATADYDITPDGLAYRSTSIREVPGAAASDALEELYAACDAAFGDGAPISVLLSGGYDSRYNLAIALRASRKTGNALHLWHAYKDDAEQALARAVAAAAGRDVHVARWSDFAEEERDIAAQPEFIRFQSGPYRDNLPRWHAYLRHIKQSVQGCSILGLGAEPHKGKFYDQIGSLDDAMTILGADIPRIQFVAKRLGLPQPDSSFHRRFFEELRARAEGFSTSAAVTDFLHYHTYVANGYGKRCHDLARHFDLPFPFLGTRFLSLVFSTPEPEKKAFGLVQRGIKQLAPELLAIPFVSGNVKSLGDTVSHTWHKYGRMAPVIDWARTLKWSVVPRSRKGGTGTDADRRRIAAIPQPRSRLAAGLRDALSSGLAGVPFVRVTYASQALLYFSLIERERNVEFRAV